MLGKLFRKSGYDHFVVAADVADVAGVAVAVAVAVAAVFAVAAAAVVVAAAVAVAAAVVAAADVAVALGIIQASFYHHLDRQKQIQKLHKSKKATA